MPCVPLTQRRHLSDLQKGKIIGLLDTNTSYTEIARQTTILVMIYATYVFCAVASVCKFQKIKFPIGEELWPQAVRT